MPIYEYQCPTCDHAFESLVMSSSERVACEKCGSDKVEKQFSVFGVGASTEAPGAEGCSPQGCERPQCGQRM